MISNLARNFSTKIAVGVSGGVDSAVAALVLKNKGYDVHGVFMRNWDELDETGLCKADNECATAEWVCNKIGIPFTEMNFVKNYWSDVFQYLLAGYQRGHTPNPDILCNKHIKFGSLIEECMEKIGAHKIATGHYARIHHLPDGDVRLLQGLDAKKDQSFFLSQVKQTALQKAVFPLGELNKSTVRIIAKEAGLHLVSNKKESMGICFIGKRNFPDFISQYIDDKPGRIIDIDTNEDIGSHDGQHLWTLGQRLHLEGATIYKYYVVKKSKQNSDIFVCSGVSHPSLYSDSFITHNIHWVTPQPPVREVGEEFSCEFRSQHLKPLTRCTVTLRADDVKIKLNRVQRVITEGQFAVLYDGEECLGSAAIKSIGPSVYDLNSNGCKDSIVNLRRSYLPTLMCTDLAIMSRNYLQVQNKLNSRTIQSNSEEIQLNNKKYMNKQMEAKNQLKYFTHGDFIKEMLRNNVNICYNGRDKNGDLCIIR